MRRQFKEKILQINYRLLIAALCCLSMNVEAASVKIADQELFGAERLGRYFVVHLRQPHRVLSSARVNGGQSDQFRYLVNHQSMEASGDKKQYEKILEWSGQQYHQAIAKELGIPPNEMTLIGTAASMNHIAHVTHTFKELRVDAFVTAGVKGNALRAGDPARWYQGEKGNEFIPHHGTINTIVIINTPLTAGAQAKSVISVVEAKSAALAELAIPSTVSSHLATGTGTDQYIVASALIKDKRILESASPHLKLGELIGRAVFDATKEALRWQNGLEPSYTRTLMHALGRFGLTEQRLMESLKPLLTEYSYQLLNNNRHSVLYDPRVGAAAFAYAAVLDRLNYESISQQLAPDVLKDQAANVAVALSLKPKQWPDYWDSIILPSDDKLAPFIQAIALGWEAKWQP